MARYRVATCNKTEKPPGRLSIDALSPSRIDDEPGAVVAFKGEDVVKRHSETSAGIRAPQQLERREKMGRAINLKALYTKVVLRSKRDQDGKTTKYKEGLVVCKIE